MYPMFFVSVAAKGVNHSVSLLFATFARRFISVAAKGLGVHQNCAKREHFVGADYEAFRDRGFGKCVEARGRDSKQNKMEIDKGRWYFNTEFTEDTEMRRSGGRLKMGSNYQRAW